MTRGHIYHVAAYPEAFPGIDEDDFCEHLDLLGCDQVDDVPAEDAALLLSSLADAFRHAGFSVRTTDLPDDCAFVLETGYPSPLRSAKCAWFSKRFGDFKSLAAGITLDAFSCGTDAIAPIQNALDDRYGDLVYLDMGTGPATYGLPRFVRALEPHRDYFFEDACVRMR